MKKSEFKKLQVGDVIHHPLTGNVAITSIQQDFDYDTTPPTPYTWAVETTGGRYLKINDTDQFKISVVAQVTLVQKGGG